MSMAREVLLGALLLLPASACSGSAAAALRPSAPTARQALGEELNGQSNAPERQRVCLDVSQGARPLVVDWKPEERADLEVAMSSGIAVVSYDCGRMRLLQDCFVEGSYGYKSVVLKQQVIVLRDADEIVANLPLNGTALAAQLKGELERGATLDLATALVGNLTGSRIAVGPENLTGRCEGASHFVRAANVGAFVMQRGEQAKLATAATLFSAGASAGSQSSRMARVQDGLLEECMAQASEEDRPPRNCGALYRLRLLPLSPASKDGASAGGETPPAPLRATESSAGACPEGLVFGGGKCTKPALQVAHECQPTDAVDCQKQCQAGDSLSCWHWASLLRNSGDENSLMQVADLLEGACLSDQGPACSDLGILVAQGTAGASSPERALSLFSKACSLGDANGCFNQATLHYEGQGTTVDRQRAARLFQNACDAGKPEGCINVANMYDDGDGVSQDSDLAFALFKKACEGDVAAGCSNLAYMYGSGKAVTADQTRALSLYEKSCQLQSARGCLYAGNRYVSGNGAEPDFKHAAALLKRACDLGAKEACLAAARGDRSGQSKMP